MQIISTQSSYNKNMNMESLRFRAVSHLPQGELVQYLSSANRPPQSQTITQAQTSQTQSMRQSYIEQFTGQNRNNDINRVKQQCSKLRFQKLALESSVQKLKEQIEFEYANLFDGGNADWDACWRAWKSSGAWASRPWNEGQFDGQLGWNYECQAHYKHTYLLIMHICLYLLNYYNQVVIFLYNFLILDSHNINNIQNRYKNPQPPYMHSSSSPLPKSQLTHNSLKLALQSVQLNQQDYITSTDMQQALQRLGGEQFDRQIFDQLWQQCKLNSQGKTKVYYFIQNCIRAQAILVQKVIETQGEIRQVQAKLKTGLDHSERMQLNAQLHQLKQLKAGYIIDAQIIRKPFSKFQFQTVVILPRSLSNTYPTSDPVDRTVYNPLSSLPIPINNKKNMAWMFYLSCIGILAQVIVYLYLNAFMNSVLFLLVLSMFLFEYFDRRTIRFLFWFDVFTLINQIIWFFIQAKNVWSIHQISMWPKYLNGYFKMAVIIIAIIFVMKVILAIMLCSQYNIDESVNQEVDICGKVFVLKSGNKDVSPIRRALTFGMSGGEQIQPADSAVAAGQ